MPDTSVLPDFVVAPGWSRETLFVTARHRVTVVDGSSPAWAPYGTRHLRRAGDGRTACGAVALDWPIFWDLPVDPARGDLCPACALAGVPDPSNPSTYVRNNL